MTTRLVCVHGIGAHGLDFANAWRPHLQAAAPGQHFEVVGLHWNDLLEEARKKYLAIDPQLAKALAAFGITLPDLLQGSAGTFVREYVFDVVTYCGLGEMRKWILAECGKRLADLTKPAGERNCILVGHSLGAALLLHLTELEHAATSSLTYRGMLLFGHPLGVVSPTPALFLDPLMATPKAAATREDTLRAASRHWRDNGPDRWCLVENTNDAICADVKMVIGGAQFDPIPIRQALTDSEVKAVHSYNPGAVRRFAAGTPEPDALAKNHDIATYAVAAEFRTALQGMLS
jgi:pimeloyl-ACP methyl ester carboxylesterase